MPQQQTSTTRCRRHRSTKTRTAPAATENTMATRQSNTVAHAKAKFVESVTRGVAVLMEEHGYSRERAVTALTREIARGEINPPSDREIFDAMSSRGVGIEDAARALTVSKALEQTKTQRKCTLAEAIEQLTDQLSVANLIRMDRTPSPVPADTAVSLPPRPSIQPITLKTTTLARHATKSTSITTITTTHNINNNTAAPSGRKSKQKHGNGRKRPVDDITPSANDGEKEKQPSKKEEEPNNNKRLPARARSDSLSEVVNAKFADNNNNSNNNNNNSNKTDSVVVKGPAPAAVRAKRGRVEDGVASPSALKRSRASETEL